MKQEKLKKLLLQRNISAYRVAKECNISFADMYSVINGKKPFYPKWRMKVANYFDVDESEIFDK